jgi:phosphoribosylformylglycinamidine synthase
MSKIPPPAAAAKSMADYAREFGLKAEEYDLVLTRLGREPNLVELGVFSVMWSEHCSYKSSRKHLRKFPVTGPRVLLGPGENAGVIDIGDGQAAVFKMESHNHPSYIEPYQGAATGVGGILRVSTSSDASHVQVVFTDSGGGISPENITRIFEPYFTTKSGGNGLGLLIVRRIVRAHGGEVILESSPGRGLTVRILLPRADQRVRFLEQGTVESKNE